MARHVRAEKQLGITSRDERGRHDWLLFPAHPAAQPVRFAPAHYRRVDLWDEPAQRRAAVFDDVVSAFTTPEAFAAALAVA